MGSVVFRARQPLSARFTNTSARRHTYIDRMSMSACLFLYDHGNFTTSDKWRVTSDKGERSSPQGRTPSDPNADEASAFQGWLPHY
jgi:hypothetical protein